MWAAARQRADLVSPTRMDTVNVNNGGTLVLANGASVFGGGTDTLTVNSGGALHLGDATNGSDGVTMTGLDTFTINAGATLRFL